MDTSSAADILDARVFSPNPPVNSLVWFGVTKSIGPVALYNTVAQIMTNTVSVGSVFSTNPKPYSK